LNRIALPPYFLIGGYNLNPAPISFSITTTVLPPGLLFNHRGRVDPAAGLRHDTILIDLYAKIKKIADELRTFGARIANMLSSREKAEEGRYNVSIH
jgi:hypothetical protein